MKYKRLSELYTRIFNPEIKSEKMKDLKLTALLGRDVLVGEQLSPEELQTVFAALPSPTTAHVEETSTQTTTTTETVEETQEVTATNQMLESIQSLTASVQTLTATVGGLETRLANVEKKPANETTAAPIVNGTENKGDQSLSLDSPEHPLNKLAARELGA